MPSIAVILARSGSKGLPGKNVTPIAGRACVEWTIDDALASRVDRVLVSSDDDEVLRIAHRRGVSVHRRSAECASDTATVDQAVREALVGLDADPVVILYANVPIRPSGVIDRAMQMLEESGADSVQSYQPVGKHHPWWTTRVDAQGEVRPWEGDVLYHGVYRRQDLPEAFIPTGAVIAVRRAALDLQLGVEPGPHAFFGLDRRGVVDPGGQTIDIDCALDALVADAMLTQRRRRAA
ncbi:MAG: acylneuraminate cytidylyltransferase family protein [Phycisphaerales bacterium]|nr:acylneuraminate cytidylyltransferase family protein [Phycisphaerales bacterium]